MKKQLLILIAFMTLGTIAFGQVPSYVPTNGLAGFWTFNGNANDESGNGNNGTVNGASLTSDRFSNANAAYDFDGVNDYVQGTETNFPVGSVSRSVVGWFYANPDVDNAGLLSYGGSSSPWSIMFEQSSGTKKVYVDYNQIQQVFTDSVSSLSSWQHFAVVLRGDTVDFYQNGELSNSEFATIGVNTASTGIFRMGRKSSGQSNENDTYFDGSLDDIGIWNRVLTQCEIQQLYTGNVSNPTATVTTSGATTFCQGGSVTLTASSGSSYLWSNGQTSQSITVSQTGSYSVQVTNNGCSATSQSVSVTVTNPTASISTNGSTTFCQGGSVTLTASSGDSYLWSNGQTTQSVTITQTGSYSVEVTENSCSATSQPTTVTVIVNPTATVTTSGATTFCQGGNVTLTANSGSSYLWSNGQTTQSISVSQTGTYSVEVTDNGCSTTSQSVAVTVLSNPLVTLSSFSDICSNANPLTLTGGNPSGGVYSVNSTQSSVFDPSITGVGMQTVSYTYANQNNCSGTATGTVNVLASPSVSLSGLNSNYSLSDNPSILTVSPSGGVLSGNGVSNGEFDPSNAGLGTHSVLYMYVDGNGCMGGDALCTNVDLNVGIDGTNQIATGGGIEIYPNPSSGLYSLSFEIEGVVSYSVFDSRGREIVNESFVSNGSAIKTLDLTKYSSGVYAVQVQTPKGGVIDKLIKE